MVVDDNGDGGGDGGGGGGGGYVRERLSLVFKVFANGKRTESNAYICYICVYICIHIYVY